MKRSEVKGLYFITHINNLGSILSKGIMCFQNAKKLEAKSIADEEVQKKRDKVIPGINKKLHSFANLYFNPRNPMMYKRKDMHEKLCVICIDKEILDEPDIIIADGNASSDYTRFEPSPDGLKYLDFKSVFTEYWVDDNPFDYWENKRRICAEILVPNKVEPRFINRIYVSCNKTKEELLAVFGDHPLKASIQVKPEIFFQ